MTLENLLLILKNIYLLHTYNSKCTINDHNTCYSTGRLTNKMIQLNVKSLRGACKGAKGESRKITVLHGHTGEAGSINCHSRSAWAMCCTWRFVSICLCVRTRVRVSAATQCVISESRKCHVSYLWVPEGLEVHLPVSLPTRRNSSRASRGIREEAKGRHREWPWNRRGLCPGSSIARERLRKGCKEKIHSRMDYPHCLPETPTDTNNQSRDTKASQGLRIGLHGKLPLKFCRGDGAAEQAQLSFPLRSTASQLMRSWNIITPLSLQVQNYSLN